MFQRGVIIGILLFVCGPMYAQNKSAVKIEPSAEMIIDLNNRAERLIYSDHNESLKLASQALQWAKTTDLKEEASRAYLYMAISYFLKVSIDSCESALDSAFRIATEIHDNVLIARAHNLKAAIYHQKNQLLKAEEAFRLTITLFEKLSDSISVAKAYSNLSTILNQQGKYYESLEVQHKSLLLFERFSDTVTLSIALLNISETYAFINDYKQATNYASDALNLLINSKHENLILNAYINIGEITKASGKPEQAKGYFAQALNLISKPNETVEYGSLLYAMAEVDYHLGNYRMALMNNKIAVRELLRYNQTEALISSYLLNTKIYLKQGLNERAREALNTCFVELIKLNTPDLKKEFYLVSSMYHEQVGNHEKALGFFQRYTAVKDSLYQHQKSRELTNILNQHENLRQQREIEYQKNELLLKDLEIEQNKSRLKFIVMLGLLLGVVAFLLFNLYVSIRKKNKLIASQMDELSFINVKLNEQSLAIKEQNSTLVRYKKDITDSIMYAERIQKALFSTNETLVKTLKDYFILFKPKDIVSGDFYWVRDFPDHVVVVVADCTGHGVPGAFMSLLGITLLKEIVVRNDIRTSDKVLNTLRQNLKDSLKQHGGKLDQKDGINLSFLAIDKESNEMQFTGAHSSAYIVRNDKIITLKGDVQPVGYYFKEKPFTKESLKLENNDKIYLYTDGFIDQFNDQSKRFSKRNLRNLLVKINKLPLKEQRGILEAAFENWKQSQEQFDDVLVLGFNWRSQTDRKSE